MKVSSYTTHDERLTLAVARWRSDNASAVTNVLLP
jgi:hypothetical protein